MDTINPPAVVQQSEEQQIIEEARQANEAIDAGKWLLGEAALKWVQQTGRDRTLDRLAEAIGSEIDTVQRYRHVYATFGDVADSYPRLTWSHFRVATGWDDAEDWLGSANDNQWSVATMKRMRAIQARADRGENLREGEAVSDDQGHSTEATSPDADNQPHVADEDPYQKPPSIVEPTPRDFEQEPTRTHQPVPDADSEDGPDAVSHVKSKDSEDSADGPEQPYSPFKKPSQPDQKPQGPTEATLQTALDRVESLVNAWNEQRPDPDLRAKFAAKLRRWADQVEAAS